jgi:pyruvate formate lyase activating enzyme
MTYDENIFGSIHSIYTGGMVDGPGIRTVIFLAGCSLRCLYCHFSGGEPLLQPEFLTALLRECKARGYHTAVDTAGNVPRSVIGSVLPYVDLWLYDVKAADPGKHEEAAGIPNELILENLRFLDSAGAKIIVRIPVVPGVNDGGDEIGRIAGILSELENLRYAELLPLNHAGEGKYASLGMEYKIKDYAPPSPEDLGRLAKILSASGVRVK